MKDRIERLIFFLYITETFLTASELARRMNLSRKTILSSIRYVKKTVEENGGMLSIKRGKGYLLIIENEARFNERFQLSIKQNTISNLTNTYRERVIIIAKKIISQTDSITIDSLSIQIFLSRSAIRKELKDAYEILWNYAINVNKNSKKGLTILGKEKSIRLCITDLSGMFYNLDLLEKQDQDYLRWISCDFEEAHAIRRKLLNVFRNYKIKIRDIVTQRIMMYLIVSRNRILNGYPIFLSREERQKILKIGHKEIIDCLFLSLQKEYKGFSFSLDEQLVVLEMIVCCAEQIDISNGFLNNETQEITNYIVNKYQSQVSNSLESNRFFESVIYEIIKSNLLKKEFNIYEESSFLYSSMDYSIDSSPFAIYFGRKIAADISEFIDSSLSLQCIEDISRLVYDSLNQIQLQHRKLKLLTHSANGIKNATMLIHRWNKVFGRFIISNEPVPLYEVRNLDQGQYDCILLILSKFAYKESIKPFYTTLIPDKASYAIFIDEFILPSYDIENYLPDINQIKIITDPCFKDESQFIDDFVVRKEENIQKREKLKSFLIQNLTKHYNYIINEFLIYFIPFYLVDQSFIELSMFNSPIRWDNKEIRQILFISWQDNSSVLNKIYELMIRELIHIEKHKWESSDYAWIFKKIIYEALKKEITVLDLF